MLGWVGASKGSFGSESKLAITCLHAKERVSLDIYWLASLKADILKLYKEFCDAGQDLLCQVLDYLLEDTRGM